MIKPVLQRSKPSFVCFGFLFFTFFHVSFFPTWSMSVGLVVKSFLKREMGSGYGK